MYKSQSLFNLTTALHVSGITITHLQEHKTTATTASGNRDSDSDARNMQNSCKIKQTLWLVHLVGIIY